ncbi:uncharacterized protein CTRU02_210559 [Colletotrichum truncatum]|uniref:Uncharacterized protein n=1 Tax=Colletotrichum truncatum TaxID=5467 RepID=A0ACC3YPB7_COLTU
MFEFHDFKSIQVYIVCIFLYVLATIATAVWTYQGPAADSKYIQARVFRTSDRVAVNQLYSGLALSALLAPAGMLVQRITHRFRQLRLSALTAQSALVDVFSGVIGPTTTHNVTFRANPTYNGVVFYHWGLRLRGCTRRRAILEQPPYPQWR